ncbi:acyloxyacyl hydrolase [Marinilabiliaceae bacterium ANBcel2]|nr:acyloxyacyl hydrolase [Marinilabiliaceae bacterium ANBcel2]
MTKICSVLVLQLLIFLFCNVVALSAQQDFSHSDFRFIEIRGHTGSHLYTGDELSEVLGNGYGALQVRYGWQSNNPESWQSSYLYPLYGFGWYSGFIGNPDHLGTPGALYGFISFPLFKHDRHQMVIEPAAGISYDLKPYDESSNVINDAIGSRFNVYFNLNIGAVYRLNREIDLVYGLDITHFSNGRKFRPNSGLNMVGPNVGLRYHFNARQSDIDDSRHPERILEVRPRLDYYRSAEPLNYGEFLVYGAAGVVQNDEDKGTNKQYLTLSSFLEYNYKLNSKSGFALGLNAFYDRSLKAYYPNRRHTFYGVHTGYDLMFWRLALRMQFGTYLHNRAHDFKGYYFFRPSLKFDICERLFMQVGLKTRDGFKADWVEYGIGLKFGSNR